MKKKTCFKGRGSCIDKILRNRYSFKHTSSIETGLSDHPHLISSMTKITFKRKEPKVLTYWDYKNLNSNSFKSGILSKLHHNNVSFISFENSSVNVLNKQAPKKSNVFLQQSKVNH